MTPLADPVARLRELADALDRRSKKLSGISESQVDDWSESIREIASSIEGQEDPLLLLGDLRASLLGNVNAIDEAIAARTAAQEGRT